MKKKKILDFFMMHEGELIMTSFQFWGELFTNVLVKLNLMIGPG